MIAHHPITEWPIEIAGSEFQEFEVSPTLRANITGGLRISLCSETCDMDVCTQLYANLPPSVPHNDFIEMIKAFLILQEECRGVQFKIGIALLIFRRIAANISFLEKNPKFTATVFVKLIEFKDGKSGSSDGNMIAALVQRKQIQLIARTFLHIIFETNPELARELPVIPVATVPVKKDDSLAVQMLLQGLKKVCNKVKALAAQCDTAFNTTRDSLGCEKVNTSALLSVEPSSNENSKSSKSPSLQVSDKPQPAVEAVPIKLCEPVPSKESDESDEESDEEMLLLPKVRSSIAETCATHQYRTRSQIKL